MLFIGSAGRSCGVKLCVTIVTRRLKKEIMTPSDMMGTAEYTIEKIYTNKKD